MKDRYSLLGMAAVQRLDASASPFAARMRALEISAAGLNLAPGSVHLAAEVASLEPALEAEDRIALIVLVLISLVALQEGSTRFPVTGALSRQPMRRVLGALCANGFGPDATEAIADSIENLLQSG